MPGTIKPEDFSQRVTDPNRHRWTLAKIEHVVAAMAGRPALVEIDNRTGCAFVGEIVGYASTGNSNPGPRLQFKHESGQITNYRLDEVGVIVDMTPHGSAKWDALDRERKARSAAHTEARARLLAEHGIDSMKVSSEVYADGFGRWTVTYRREGMRPWEVLARYEVRVAESVEGVSR